MSGTCARAPQRLGSVASESQFECCRDFSAKRSGLEVILRRNPIWLEDLLEKLPRDAFIADDSCGMGLQFSAADLEAKFNALPKKDRPECRGRSSAMKASRGSFSQILEPRSFFGRQNDFENRSLCRKISGNIQLRIRSRLEPNRAALSRKFPTFIQGIESGCQARSGVRLGEKASEQHSMPMLVGALPFQSRLSLRTALVISLIAGAGAREHASDCEAAARRSHARQGS